MKASQQHRFSVAAAALAMLALLAVPGTALAKTDPNQCTGVNITGQGASSNSIAQNVVWDPQFNSSTHKYACNGSQGSGGKPTVSYTNTGTGAGLESWGEFGKVTPNYGPTNAFVGTSEAFDSTTISELEANETTPTPETIETVPVLQIAVAIIVNLPANCTATSTAAPGRLVLSQKTLEAFFKGDITKWSQITDGGDALSGAGCDPTTTITPVVRPDQSGPAHYLKRFLNLVDPAALSTSKGSLTWGQLSEGSLNTTWPSALAFVTPAKKGEAEMDAKVATTPSSIGFGNLAEIRAGGKFSKSGEGGSGKQRFWVEIENENKKGKAKYADPATNGDVEAVGDANCKKTLYSNGENPFPPPTVTEPWNAVTTKLSEKTYPLCGFGFVLTTNTYSLFPGTSAGEAQTVHDLLSYVTDKKGGQAALAGHDYSALPKAVQIEASMGAKQIAF
jgi:ABC-type phosphate transport system substrate-binding protein